MEGRFSGKVVLVTGGAAGIGQGIATAFGEQGAKIAIAEIGHGVAVQPASVKQ